MATLQSLSFVPTSIAGCQFWIDAADPSTVTLSGNQITNVRDKSGNGFNLSNGSGFTYNQVKFNTSYPSFYNTTTPGTTDKIGSNASFSISQPMTAFVVGQMAATGNNFIFDGNTARIGIYQQTYNFFAGGQINGSTNVLLSPYIISALANTTNSSGFLNGSLFISGNIGTNALTSLVVGNGTGGSGSPLTGHLCELLFYSGNVSIGQRQQIEGYLAWKWGLQASLPTSHPFYYIAPNSQGLFYPSNLRIPVQVQSFLPNTAPLVYFNPTTVSGLQLWLDGADQSSFVLSGSNVTTWIDKSGNGRNTSNIFGTPTRSGSNVVFTGSQLMGTALSYSVLNANSFFSVCETTSSVASQNVIGVRTNSTDGGYQIAVYALNPRITTYGGFTAVTGSTNFTTNAKFVYNGTYNGTSTAFLYLNGSQIGSGAGRNLGSGSVTIGGHTDLAASSLGEPWVGNINEILMFNAVLSTTQRQQIEGYLAWKWGLRASLPSNHPFKNAPPGLTVPVSLPTLSFQPASFSPRNISGLQVWLDGSDPYNTGIPPANGSTVSTWIDKSGNGRNFTVVTGGPTYNTGNFVNFTASNTDYMRCVSTFNVTVGSTTVYYVAQLTGISGFGDFLSFGGGQSLRYVNGILVGTPSAAGDTNDFALNNYYVNGNFNPSGTTSTYTNVHIVSATNQNVTATQMFLSDNFLSRYFVGRIYEFLVYSSAPTLAQRQQIEGYLAWKWNVVGNLPNNFPFKRLPPPPG